MYRTREVLQNHIDSTFQPASVLITHTHSDHISYYPLRVLQEFGLPVYLNENCTEQLKSIHFNGDKFANLKLKPFKNREFEIGDMKIKPFEVIHNPWFPTYGFEIFHKDKKAVVVTDFCSWENIYEHFIDADFIFVESNHDLKLLELYYNPNSRFHMPNPQTGNLLVNAVKQSSKAPQIVMLGHISRQRNKPAIAVNETKKSFQDADIKMNFQLLAAPLLEAGEPVKLK